MKKIIEGIKDFIYDSIDYFIILSVVLVVGVIVGWRLPQLFAPDMDKHDINDSENVIAASGDLNTKNIVEDDTVTIENDIAEVVDDTENKDVDSKDANSESNDTSVDLIVEIPSGSSSPKIGEILKNKGLIEDTNIFLKKAKELELDTKLQSGTFTIPSSSSLEDIIKIISRQKRS